jgi:pSer/pThr/pTyr-binding forkhead associated (FHA) protein
MTDDELTPQPVATQDAEDAIIAEDSAVVDDAAIAGEGEALDEQTAHPRLDVKRNGVETGDSFPINPPATIGRFDPSVGPIDVDLGPLPEGVYVSRKHARIVQEDDVWKIQDLGSSNGTFVLRDDFERVEEAEIEDGTEIALGNARFVFKLS